MVSKWVGAVQSIWTIEMGGITKRAGAGPGVAGRCRDCCGPGRRLLAVIQACLKPGGKLLVAEPRIHVQIGRSGKRWPWRVKSGRRSSRNQEVVFEKTVP